MKIDEIIEFLFTEAEKGQVLLPSEAYVLYNAAGLIKRHEDYFKRIYNDEDLG